jgi:ubiquinone/menaquinone biosynthesis C-methylase UbiE
MPDYPYIYSHQAPDYEQLVIREDYQGNLLPALERIRPLAGLDVVEFGAGTGRVTALLRPFVRSIFFCDGSAHMLAIATAKLKPDGFTLATAVADNRHIPAVDGRFDLAIAGWSFSNLMGVYPETWPAEVALVVGEMKRLLRPGGTAVIIETLGTGETTPRPPKEYLADYYRMLEEQYGFAATWIRTDYRFETTAEAEASLTFFFGPQVVERLDRQRLTLPECTGIWWLHT